MSDNETQIGGSEEEAFESIVKDFADKDVDLSTLLQHIQDSSVSNTNTSEQSQEQANVPTNQVDSAQTPTEVTQESTLTDLQQRYDDLVVQMKKKEADNASTLNLVYSRLNHLSDLYQQERNRRDSDTTAKAEVPGALKELQELYPEVYAGMQAYFENKYKDIENILESKIGTVKNSIQTITQQSHAQTIMNAHPDVHTIIESGKLNAWVESLDPITKAGANSILQYGDADAVNKLLTRFKESTMTLPTASNMNITKTSKPSTGSNLSEEDIKKIISAFGVTNNRNAAPTVSPGMGDDENMSEKDWFDRFVKEDEKNISVRR